MTVGEIVELAVRPDGTRLRGFRVDGVRVQVHALDPGHDAAAAELIARLRAACAAAEPPAEPATRGAMVNSTRSSSVRASPRRSASPGLAAWSSGCTVANAIRVGEHLIERAA